MRIAWIVYGAIGQTTGGYIYDRLVVERLRARGDDVRIVSLDPSPASRALAGLSLARRVARIDPDVIVGDELCFRELGPAFAVLRGRAARVLLVHHLSAWELSAGVRRAAILLREGAAIRLSHALVTTSTATALRLRRELGAPQVEVVAPGADRLPRVARCPPDGERITLAFIGSFIPRKGLLGLLEAFERVGCARARLVLVGDATRDPAYAARVRRAALGSSFLRERVTLPGPLPDLDLAGVLAEADALVLPSSLEGYGMVLTEALYAGVPVLSARVGAVEEVFGDGGEALLWDSPEGLTGALRRFCDDPGLRDRMRRAAESRAPSLPTWDDAAERMRVALARALSRRAVSPSAP